MQSAKKLSELRHVPLRDGVHGLGHVSLSGAGYALLDSPVVCMLTRFRLRSFWSIIPFYFAFRRIRRDCRSLTGLLKAVFLVEDLHTCYTLSLWKSEIAIAEFGSVKSHIDAANLAFGPVFRKDLHRPEIWSAQFRLWAVSCHNLNWEGVDVTTGSQPHGEPVRTSPTTAARSGGCNDG